MASVFMQSKLRNMIEVYEVISYKNYLPNNNLDQTHLRNHHFKQLSSLSVLFLMVTLFGEFDFVLHDDCSGGNVFRALHPEEMES